MTGAGYGTLLATIGIGGALGPLVLLRLVRAPHAAVRVRPFGLRGVVDLVLAATTALPIAATALVAYGVGTSTGTVTFSSLLQVETADRLRGPVLASMDVLWQTGRLASLGSAACPGHLDVRAVYLVRGLVLVVAAGYGCVSRDRRDSTRVSGTWAVSIEHDHDADPGEQCAEHEHARADGAVAARRRPWSNGQTIRLGREDAGTVPKVIYVAGTGQEHVVDAPVGESVMAAAVKNGVPGIIGECGGNASCATCHVWVREEFMPLVGGPSGEMEEDLLDLAVSEPRDTSRLSCQIPVTPVLDGLTVDIPPQQP